MVMTTASRRRQGFTLIELLVVIAIIALLIGILLPALGKARRAGREAKNLANVRSMGIAMTLYANDFKSWLPLMPFTSQARAAWNNPNPNNRFLDYQYVYGGVAGLFSLYQVGDGQDTGYRGLSNDPDTAAYADGNRTPIMRAYIEGLSVLVNPMDKEDRWYNYPYGPASLPSYSAARIKLPQAPGGEQDVITYNISYLYIAGFKTDEPKLMVPVPFWGDETNGPDISTFAWYGGGGGGTSNATEAGTQPGGYAPSDNLGRDGGAFVYTDGHAAFQKSQGGIPENQANSIQNIFFSTDTNRFPSSINGIDRNRSRFIQTLD